MAIRGGDRGSFLGLIRRPQQSLFKLDSFEGSPEMAYNVPQLLEMSNAQLDGLFSSGAAGEIPDGPAKGTAIIASGTKFSAEIAEFINLFGWQGKTFDAKRGVLRNRILPMGLKTSLVAHWIRDEIRAIGPGFYLGRVYWAKKPLIHFALEFPQP